MTNKYVELFNYFQKCPQLNGLWSIAGMEEQGNKIVLPNGASGLYSYNQYFDIMDNFFFEMNPTSSYYEDYRINCYSFYDEKDSSAPETNVNILELQEVQNICDWIFEQNQNDNLPVITGKKVLAIECLPSIPQVAYVTPEESTIAYFITVRVTYKNDACQKVRVISGS